MKFPRVWEEEIKKLESNNSQRRERSLKKVLHILLFLDWKFSYRWAGVDLTSKHVVFFFLQIKKISSTSFHFLSTF